MKKPHDVAHTTNTPPKGTPSAGTSSKDTPTVMFVLPSYKTPLLVSELLSTALNSGKYAGCLFMLLLDVSDPTLNVYKACVKTMVEKGLDVGIAFYDGTSYAGMVNRVALLADAKSICVINAKHMPYCKDGFVAEHINKWLESSMEPMRLATAGVAGEVFPIVTPRFIDRLGYLFHPLSLGRVEAERWLVDVAKGLGVAANIPELDIIASGADGAEIIGRSDEEFQAWVMDVLGYYLETEVDRLSDYVLR